jgi:DNA-binding response OmpR family regulator
MENKKKDKILIIEDDANILYGLQAMFSLEGYEVEINNGCDEIEYILNHIRESKPDYIVLDLILPKIDGATLLKVLKSEEGVNQSCIFTFTNLSEEDSKKWTVLLGSDYYFIKNEFVIDAFVDKVKKIIKNRQKMGRPVA